MHKIMKLALPAIASNVTIPLLGICDTAITGHLGSEIYLAAIAAGGTIVNVTLWLCGFLRMGTSGLAAEAYGAASPSRISSVFWRSVFMAATLGILIMILREPIFRLFNSIIQPSTDIAPSARQYFSIMTCGIPPLLITLSINGWFIGMQDTARPMIISISMNLFNIAASVAAVYLFKAGFAGVAYGTVSANWLGLILASVLAARFSNGRIMCPYWREVMRGGELKRFFGVSSDLMLRSACIMAVSLSITAFGSRMGADTLALNGVLLQFFLFFSYFTDGFSFAAEALCGKASGAANIVEFKSTVRNLIATGLLLAIFFTAAYFLLFDKVVDFLTDSPSVRIGSRPIRPFITAIPLVSVWAFIYDGIFVGLTATRRMFLTTLCSALLFFLSYWILSRFIFPNEPLPAGNMILWGAFLLFLGWRGAGLALQMNKSASTQIEKNILNLHC